MSFRGLARDIRDGIGSLSRRGFDVKFRGKSHGAVYELHDEPVVIQSSCWANLPLELLRDVIQRLEESESTWPARKHVVACGSVCRSWREMCREIVQCPEYSGKLTFPISLKQPGFRDGTMQCFIKRNKSNLTYHLFLCLSPVLLIENGKFLLSAKRNRRTTCTEYVISMDADNISRSRSTYIGKVRSNFLGTKFIIYDTQPPHDLTATSSTSLPSPTSRRFHSNSASITSQPGPTSHRFHSNPASIPSPLGPTSHRFHSKRVSPKLPIRNHAIAQVTYELNVLGTRGPRRMHCAMRSIPTSAIEPGGVVPGRPEILHRSIMDDSFRSSISFSKRIDSSAEFASARFSDIGVGPHDGDGNGNGDGGNKTRPLVLKNKAPRWHEQLQCWCLNFRGRVTVASVKNFQLIASGGGGGAGVPAAGQQSQPSSSSSDHDKVILQFGKVGKDMFTMDYRYPLSAFQAFAICLSSFDTKLACE